MTQEPEESEVTVPDLRLREKPRPVLRLSRKALLVGGTVLSIGVGVALILALQPMPAKPKPVEPVSETKSQPVNEKLNALPKTYSEVPKLGPPLPGDFGRPMLRNNSDAGVMTNASTAVGETGQTPSYNHASPVQQAATAAISSQILTASHGSAGYTGSALPTLAVTTSQVDRTAEAGFAELQPTRQEAFLSKQADRQIASNERLQPPLSPYVLLAGSIIPAALVTGVKSDVPGQVIAQISQPVYDSLRGQMVLIPQGARLIGQYDSSVAFGQNRVLLKWTRLIMPNGASLLLDNSVAADNAGVSGLQDKTDYHIAGLAGAALLSTVLAIGAESGTSTDESDLERALRAGAADSIARTGQQIVSRQLTVQPSLRLRNGLSLRVVLSRDLILEPYGE